MLLTFVEAEHAYYVDGVRVPNVTSILKPLTDYSMIGEAQMEIARQKGKATHRMVELWASGQLESVPVWMKPIEEQWLKFVAETRFELLKSEYRVYHPTYRFAGTLDLLGNIHGELAIVDIKRSFMAGPAIGYQLAAYESAYFAQHKEAGIRRAKRFALKLNEQGPYKLEPFTDENDLWVFLACLTVHNAKLKINAS